MSGLIRWFATHRVAANFLFVVVLSGGALGLLRIPTQVFPALELPITEVSFQYLGAGPEEVERNALIPIEEAIDSVDGVRRIESTGWDGGGAVFVRLFPGSDIQKVVNDLRTAVRTIDSFPPEVEQLRVREVAPRDRVLELAVHGRAALATLTALGERLRLDLLTLPEVSVVELQAPEREISIEVSDEMLRRHGLSFDDVAAAIRRASVDLPSGTIRTEGGEVHLRSRRRAYGVAEFRAIPVLREAAGAGVQLGDIATVQDGFGEAKHRFRFDGTDAVGLAIYAFPQQDLLELVRSVRQHLEVARTTLPEGVEITLWNDDSEAFFGQLAMLRNNALMGLALVFTLLMLFLRPALALWVTAGMVFSFFGAFWVLPLFGVTLNGISLFAFLMVLGIVVDDAIVVAERVHREQAAGRPPREGAIEGALHVAAPVTMAVVTTLVAVAPPLFFTTIVGHIVAEIPVVVIAVLSFSLLESFLVLPAHLALRHPALPGAQSQLWLRLAAARARVEHSLLYAAEHLYAPVLERCRRSAPLTLAGFVAAAILSVAMVASGRLPLQLAPDFLETRAMAWLRFAEGTPLHRLEEVMEATERAYLQVAEDTRGELEGELAVHYGARIQGRDVRVIVELSETAAQQLGIPEFLDRWLAALGEVPDAETVRFTASEGESEGVLQVVLVAASQQDLRQGVEQLGARMAAIPGVLTVGDELERGRSELLVRLKEEAESLGLRQRDLARQIRQAFYGEIVDRLPGELQTTKVMLRLPRADRRSLQTVQELWIRLPDGGEIPFPLVAEVAAYRALPQVTRVEGRRTAKLLVQLDLSQLSQDDAIRWLREVALPELQEQFPGFGIQESGHLADRTLFLDEAMRYFALAVFAIYGILCIATNSYGQPALILSAVPFGVMGAILGHLLMGRSLTILSVIGVIAVAGVVVNDNLVLIDAINRFRERGVAVAEAVRRAAIERFRPIVLTTATTFLGMLPLLFDGSFQAYFVTPMAISLAFGVAIATFATLLLVPSLYTLIGQRGGGGAEPGEGA